MKKAYILNETYTAWEILPCRIRENDFDGTRSFAYLETGVVISVKNEELHADQESAIAAVEMERKNRIEKYIELIKEAVNKPIKT